MPHTPGMRRLSLLVLALSACAGDPGSSRERTLLVTTTTVEDSGLLDALVEAYHAAQDRFHLSTTAVGSGAALEIGRRGDADFLLTHDSLGEAAFMAERAGLEAGPVMRNEFVLAGPSVDPAGIRGETDLAAALRRIDASGSVFVSRGDGSGTHTRELQLWQRAGKPVAVDRPAGYLEAGSGMGDALRLADQREAYVLTDAATLKNLQEGLRLEPLATGEPPEENPYTYIVPVAPRNMEGALDFRDWLLGPGQQVIASYGAERFGAPLFTPAARAGS